MSVPAGATGYLNTLYYKIGRHGYVYYWNEYDWIKSEWPADKIKTQIEKGKEKILGY